MGKTQQLGNYVNAIFQDASNNVGIGAAPSGSYKLEVTGTAKVSGALTGAGATFSGIVNVGVAGSGLARIQPGSSTQAGYFEIFKGDGSTRLGYMGYSNTNFAFNAENSASFTFTGGNMGIGTEPGTKLDVLVASNNKIQFGTSFVGSSGQYVGGFYYESNKLTIQSFLVGTDYQPLLLAPNGGNVGINTSSPTGTYGKLTVAGGITIADDNNAKFEIGRYSSGAPNSYIKIGTNSGSLRITNAADSADLVTFLNTGNVGIGITTPLDLLSISSSSPSMSLRYTAAGTVSTPVQANFYFRDFTGSGDIRGGIYFQDLSQNTSGCNMLLRLMNNSGTIITSINMQRDGSVFNYNNSSTWQQTSDIKIKENIRPINDALGKLCALNPTHFEYKNNLGVTKTGFIAQEFEQIFAGHISEKEPTEEYLEYFEEGEKMKSIDADLIPYLVKAIQELNERLNKAGL
jgi:hypothetical protein